MDSRVRARWIAAAVLFVALTSVPLAVLLATGDTPEPIPTHHRLPSYASEEQAPPEDSPDEPEPRTRVVVGRVRELDGTPIAGALLQVTGFSGVHTASDNDGRYRLTLVPLAAKSVDVEADGYLGARVVLGRPRTDDEHADVELRKDELAGRVLDAHGDAAPGATVRCGERETTTDRAGRFRFPGEAEGCSASAKHVRLGETPHLLLTREHDNELRFGGGGLIAGVVVDERNVPLTSFTIGIDRGPSREGERLALDDPAGRFEVSGLAAGRYVLAAIAPGRPAVLTGALDLAPGERLYGVRIVVALGVALRGRVLDAANRAPIEGARVQLESVGMLHGHRPVSALSDATGTFVLEGVPSGPLSLAASAPGYRTSVGSVSARTSVGPDLLLTPLAAGEERATEWTGIAAALRGTPAGVVVGTVFPGGPAETAGVRPGDLVAAIDGQSMLEMGVGDCVSRLRGPVGTWVSLTVRRQQGGDSVDVELAIRRERFVR